MLNLNHKKLKAWEKSIKLIKEAYKVTSKLPKEEMYGLTNQIRRASVSIASNIAEGASRKSLPERKRFYQIARSSLVEVDTQMEICTELEFLKTEDICKINVEANNVFALLTAMINNTK
jgi:four helix bundle protein